MADASVEISPRPGLPELPVAEWPGADDVPAPGLHGKTAFLVRRTGGRLFVWLDDEITGVDRRWVALHHGGPALLHPVDARSGLTGDDFAAVAQWMASVPPRTG